MHIYVYTHIYVIIISLHLKSVEGVQLTYCLHLLYIAVRGDMTAYEALKCIAIFGMTAMYNKIYLNKIL